MHPVMRDVTPVTKVDVDFIITGGRSTFLLTPVSERGRDWCEQRLGLSFGMGSVSIEQNRIAAVASDISNDGLKVRWSF